MRRSGLKPPDRSMRAERSVRRSQKILWGRGSRGAVQVNTHPDPQRNGSGPFRPIAVQIRVRVVTDASRNIPPSEAHGRDVLVVALDTLERRAGVALLFDVHELLVDVL